MQIVALMKLLVKIIFLLLTILSTSRLYAQKQGQSLVDSLLKELPRQKEDTNKVKLLNSLAAYNIGGYPDKNVTYEKSKIEKANEGIQYGQLAVVLAANLDWKKGEADAYYVLGQNYLIKSDFNKTMECYHKSENLYDSTFNAKDLANVIFKIGNLYGKENISKTFECFFTALRILEKTKDHDLIGLRLLDIANTHCVYGDHVKGLEYYFQAMKEFEKSGNARNLACCNVWIGNVYKSHNDVEKALKYYLMGLIVFERAGDKYNTATTCTGVSECYSDMHDYVKSLHYYEKAMQLFEVIGSKMFVSDCLYGIGNIYSKQGEHLSAIAKYKDGFKLAKESGSKAKIDWGLYFLGNEYLSLFKSNINIYKEFSKKYNIPLSKKSILKYSIVYLRNGLDSAKLLPALDEEQVCYQALAEAYHLDGDFRNAFGNYCSYISLRDSVFSKENNMNIVKMGMENEFSKQRLADSLKNIEKQSIETLKLQRQRSYTYIGMTGILLLLCFSFFIIKERQKSEKLLLNILPSEVAAELKAKGATEAKLFNNVTVLFSDFVSFTKVSEQLTPNELVNELNMCFKAFDKITDKYHIEKIKTIGDAYLAVCGLPLAENMHAENAVSAAREISAFMLDRRAKLGNRTFEVRIGLHSGSVVAGIVGIKKFAYDIWGDTVNTAARMEQNSEAGKINISETTYELVKDKFKCEFRGEIEAKGKGQLKMYYVS